MKNVLATMAGALLLAANSVCASPITLATDPALSGGTVVDFESTVLGTYPTLTVGGLTITSGATVTNDASCQYGGTSNCLVNEDSQSLTFTFTSPISAFGFDLGAVNFDSALTAYDSLNQVLEVVTVPDQVTGGSFPYAGFWGINAGSAVIDHFTMQAVISDIYGGDVWVVDNVTYATGSESNPVPEPSTLLLLGTGLLTVAARRRRAQRS